VKTCGEKTCGLLGWVVLNVFDSAPFSYSKGGYPIPLRDILCTVCYFGLKPAIGVGCWITNTTLRYLR
jgi:hypothetical protein